MCDRFGWVNQIEYGRVNHIEYFNGESFVFEDFAITVFDVENS